MSRIPALALLALLAAPPALAQGEQTRVAELMAEGQQLAATWCANCHVTGPAQRSAPGDAAPTFTSIAMRPATTAESLRRYLRQPHPDMPDYRLSNQQLDALAAHILGLVVR